MTDVQMNAEPSTIPLNIKLLSAHVVRVEFVGGPKRRIGFAEKNAFPIVRPQFKC